jgi:hypothetical protein
MGVRPRVALAAECLRAGLKKYVERERELAMRKDPVQEVWLEKITVADQPTG